MGAARPPEELEGDQSVQERSLPAPEGAGREGRSAPPYEPWRRAHDAHEGAGGLHRSEGGGALQGRGLPLLGDSERTGHGDGLFLPDSALDPLALIGCEGVEAMGIGVRSVAGPYVDAVGRGRVGRVHFRRWYTRLNTTRRRK